MKKKFLPLLAIAPALLWLANCSETPKDKDDTVVTSNPLTWKVPVDIQDTSRQVNYYEFGWQSFVALNWPADPSYRGKPDTTAQIGANVNGDLLKVVWESWKEQYEIFLEDGVNPGNWNDNYTNNAKNLKVLKMFSKIDTSAAISDEFNEAFAGPLIDQDSQYVRYEVRTNESEYDYYVNNSYYNADSQKVAVSQNRFVGFPKGNDPLSQGLQYWAQYGATEVKASWRVFTASTPQSEKDRYFRKKAILVNSMGQRDTAEVGLVGMHILRLTPVTHNTWYWASFEQVDNVKLQGNYGGTMPGHPTFNSVPAVNSSTGYTYNGSTTQPPAAISPGQPMPAKAFPVFVSAPPFNQMDSQLDSVNMVYHNLLAGTPFQYYQMIGTVNPPNSSSSSYTNTANGYASVTVNTNQMANATMETYFYQSNCITCHITGYPQTFTKDDSIHASGNDQIFTFLPGLAQSANTSQLKKKR